MIWPYPSSSHSTVLYINTWKVTLKANNALVKFRLSPRGLLLSAHGCTEDNVRLEREIDEDVIFAVSGWYAAVDSPAEKAAIVPPQNSAQHSPSTVKGALQHIDYPLFRAFSTQVFLGRRIYLYFPLPNAQPCQQIAEKSLLHSFPDTDSVGKSNTRSRDLLRAQLQIRSRNPGATGRYTSSCKPLRLKERLCGAKAIVWPIYLLSTGVSLAVVSGYADEESHHPFPQNANEILPEGGGPSAELSPEETEYLKRMMRETLEDMLNNPGYMQLAKARSLNLSPDKTAAFQPRLPGTQDNNMVNFATAVPLCGGGEPLPTPSEGLKLFLRDNLEGNMHQPAVMRHAKAQVESSTRASYNPYPVARRPVPYYPPNYVQANDVPLTHYDYPAHQQYVHSYNNNNVAPPAQNLAPCCPPPINTPNSFHPTQCYCPCAIHRNINMGERVMTNGNDRRNSYVIGTGSLVGATIDPNDPTWASVEHRPNQGKYLSRESSLHSLY
ncbi:hypothetical protein VP01_2728g4 [Puccinia sorghi]|uniref:Uncharacterized protein n=1 Tax=Puccinia sorghi TaxID=27349 RepID=A0A0L6V537_9BASI|nr:hypothetical protein VP01_2728g4 [Puccinia sorghi]